MPIPSDPMPIRYAGTEPECEESALSWLESRAPLSIDRAGYFSGPQFTILDRLDRVIGQGSSLADAVADGRVREQLRAMPAMENQQ